MSSSKIKTSLKSANGLTAPSKHPTGVQNPTVTLKIQVRSKWKNKKKQPQSFSVFQVSPSNQNTPAKITRRAGCGFSALTHSHTHTHMSHHTPSLTVSATYVGRQTCTHTHKYTHMPPYCLLLRGSSPHSSVIHIRKIEYSCTPADTLQLAALRVSPDLSSVTSDL